jgi:hypothetical protein
MADRSIVEATTKMCIEFQKASAASYAEARMWIDGRDKYAPRVINHQKIAASYAAEARMRLSQLIGT